MQGISVCWFYILQLYYIHWLAPAIFWWSLYGFLGRVFLPENPRDGGAWWAAIYGIAQSRTWLKWLSSSSNINSSPVGARGKEPACQCRRLKRQWLSPWVGKITWRRKWHPTSVFLPGEFHGQRSLVDKSPWGLKESDMTEWLNTHIFINGSV